MQERSKVQFSLLSLMAPECLGDGSREEAAAVGLVGGGLMSPLSLTGGEGTEDKTASDNPTGFPASVDSSQTDQSAAPSWTDSDHSAAAPAVVEARWGQTSDQAAYG